MATATIYSGRNSLARFLECLELLVDEPGAFAGQVDDFIGYLRDERGLSASSLKARRWHVDCFLQTSLGSKDSIAQVTAEDIDGFLSLKSRQSIISAIAAHTRRASTPKSTCPGCGR